MKKILFKILVALMLLSSMPFLSIANERTDFKVNDESGKSQQNNSRIEVATDGSFVITWVDRRNSSADIYLQAYDTTGTEIGKNILINDDSIATFQAAPAIGIDYFGQYSLVWQDYRDGSYPFDPHIYLQRMQSPYTFVGSNSALTTGSGNIIRESPDVALSSWGGGVIVWADNRNSNWDVFGQLISSDGTLVGGNFMINDDLNNGQQHAPRVSASPDGWFVVTWYDNRFGDDDIYAQIYDTLGSKIGANFRASTDGSKSRQAFPDVAADGTGHFTIVWVDWRNGAYPNNPDIYSARFDTLLYSQKGNIKVNLDNAITSQREPSISSDRMGNVSIIWADSTADSWDITGQMLDVDGKIRESNFMANIDGDSTQKSPDVALDGIYRYVTWTDNRNGNLDIYASITKYNDRSLAVYPSAMLFEFSILDSKSDSQIFVIDHNGYNSMNYQVTTPTENWLSLNKLSGTTTDTIIVTTSANGLSEGSYTTSVTIIDIENNDSSLVLPIKLTVVSPKIVTSFDSLYLENYIGIDTNYTSQLSISSSSNLEIDWSLIHAPFWILFDIDSSTTPTNISMSIDISTLDTGKYFDSIVIFSSGASNSPKVIPVVQDILYPYPTIELSLDSIYFETDDIFNFDTVIVVSNSGFGSLNWSATSDANWMNIFPETGTDSDSIWITAIDTTLDTGLYIASLIVTDSLTSNIFVTLSLVINIMSDSIIDTTVTDTTSDTTIVIEPLIDTIIIPTMQVQPNESNQLSLSLILNNDISSMHFNFSYSDTIITIDSVVSKLDTSQFMNSIISIDNVSDIITLDIYSIDSSFSLSPGDYILADIFFTATATPGQTTISSDSSGAGFTYFISSEPSADTLIPIIIAGDIFSSIPTAVDETENIKPSDFDLFQNYPNPFNLSTDIEFTLTRTIDINLSIYNILGQEIAVLADGKYSSGRHIVSWNGEISRGQTAPSGIYFYRLRAGNESTVKKMLLIK